MSDAHFLRAILAAPDDDGPRLLYADWLEEHGQPERAEFIRIECEQAHIRNDPVIAPSRWDSPRFWELEERHSELEKRHARVWFASLFEVSRGEMSTRRGFPYHVALSAQRFIERGAAIFKAAPTIEDVFIDQLGRHMPDLARCRALGHVRRLTFFETPVRTREAEQLAASPYLGNLRALEIPFTDTQIGPRGAVALARAKSLRCLEHLDVYNHAIYDEGAEALFRSKRLNTLKRLHLGNNGLSDETALALYEAGHLALTSLDLMQNHLSSRVAALSDSTHLAGLEFLSLSSNPIGRTGALHLRGACFNARLRELHVWGCGLDDAALAELFHAPRPRLTDLSVGQNRLGADAARVLAGNTSLAQLETLKVGRCDIGPAVAEGLGRVSLPRLHTLEADHNPLGPDGVRGLLAGPLVSPVSHLDLEEAELGDDGAEAVADSPVLATVKWLELRDNRIGNRGAIALAESPHLAGVQMLDVSGNAFGAKGKKALARRFGERARV